MGSSLAFSSSCNKPSNRPFTKNENERWEQLAQIQCVQSRRNDPEVELQRLRETVLTREKEQQFDQKFQRIFSSNKYFIKLKKIYAQALEMEKLHQFSNDPQKDILIDRPFTEKENHNFEEKSLAICLQSRKNDPIVEIQRLRESEILTPENECWLNQADQEVGFHHKDDPAVHNRNIYLEKLKLAKKAYGQALEIREIFKSTHYVLIHAQSSRWLFLSDLITAFMKHKNEGKEIGHFQYLRMVPEVASHDITLYSKGKPGLRYEKNEQSASDLLFADLCFRNNAHYDSARSFLMNNKNFADENKMIAVTTSILRNFCPHLSSQECFKLTEKLFDLARNDPCIVGNLFVLCVPKTLSEKMMYPAHPAGSPCTCHAEENLRNRLEAIQNNEINPQTCCKALPTLLNPQFCLYTPEMTPDQMKILMIETDQEYRNRVKNETEKMVSVVYKK